MPCTGSVSSSLGEYTTKALTDLRRDASTFRNLASCFSSSAITILAFAWSTTYATPSGPFVA